MPKKSKSKLTRRKGQRRRATPLPRTAHPEREAGPSVPFNNFQETLDYYRRLPPLQLASMPKSVAKKLRQEEPEHNFRRESYRTKQTARGMIGGRAPRKQLATRAAARPVSSTIRSYDEESEDSDS